MVARFLLDQKNILLLFFLKKNSVFFKEKPGFTLVELCVVLLIAAILTFGVVTMFTSNKAKVKSAALGLRSDINLARSEAVVRNKDVVVQFVFSISESSFVNGSGGLDGYRVCVDGDTGSPNNTCGDADDTVIRDTRMMQGVRFYDTTGGAVAGGPTNTSGGASLVNRDGITFTSNKFKMRSNGTSNLAGTVVVYVPSTGSPATMLVEPFAVVMANTGRVRMERWRTDNWYDK